MDKYLLTSSLLGVSAIAFDYIGNTHSLKTSQDIRKRRAWHTANEYHIVHAAALAAVAWAIPLLQKAHGAGVHEELTPTAKNLTQALYHLTTGFWLMTAGAGGFAGSIYALSLKIGNPMFVGPITPTSGLILVWGWVNVGLAGLYMSAATKA
ncbi:hypothetical protein AGDE_05071 [Angomonas deanei]|uniref:DUF423-domain-containing protein n=1 Tax=Angomonas deanei TaxID=59799 RepID=S9VNI2_9TRYP|nr:hypothetical protein AGDE_12148 [Angomonas deanei]EPY38858.1 hypothetical protein AGDE_05071 [Angomonas deanei]CAD2218883.1 Protein of unknown function (DUF423), putative [Angomonas deanei]|eukprot:EPY24835.1 hypothetical protein AGDE_12148 [Angomonas deanei]